MVEPILQYVRARYYIAHREAERYYRLFGGFEYELKSLQTERTLLGLGIEKIKRDVGSFVGLIVRDDHEPTFVSNDITDHYYNRLQRMQVSIARALDFRYDTSTEEKAFILLADIVEAVMGINDQSRRSKEKGTMFAAIEAYGNCRPSELIDLHDSIQPLLALERRTTLKPDELRQWKEPLATLYTTFPLRYTSQLDSKEWVDSRIDHIRSRIYRQRRKLEQDRMTYVSLIKLITEKN